MKACKMMGFRFICRTASGNLYACDDFGRNINIDRYNDLFQCVKNENSIIIPDNL